MEVHSGYTFLKLVSDDLFKSRETMVRVCALVRGAYGVPALVWFPFFRIAYLMMFGMLAMLSLLLFVSRVSKPSRTKRFQDLQ